VKWVLRGRARAISFRVLTHNATMALHLGERSVNKPAMVLHCEGRRRDAGDCRTWIVAADTALSWTALILIVMAALATL
jgi:hypothetical protein